MQWDDSLADEWDEVDDLHDALPADESVVVESLPDGILLRGDGEERYVYARDEDLLHDTDADVDHHRRERR